MCWVLATGLQFNTWGSQVNMLRVVHGVLRRGMVMCHNQHDELANWQNEFYAMTPNRLGARMLMPDALQNSQYLETLVAFFPDILTDKFGNTSLHLCSRHNYIEQSRVLCQYMGAVDPVNQSHLTPLCIAVIRNHYEICEILLHHDADPNYTHERELFTPLHKAASNGNGEICDLLLFYDADRGAKDYYGLTPYDHAVNNGYHDIAKRLFVRVQ